MAEDRQAKGALVCIEDLDRREFIRKLLVAGIGAPAALGLTGVLAGCDTSSGVGGGVPVQTLQQVVNQGLGELQAVRDDILNGGDESDAVRQGWLDAINSMVRDLWEAVGAADDAERRGAVHPDMQEYMDRLNDWEVPLRTPVEVPQWELQDFADAGLRAAAILNAQAGADVRRLLIFVLMGCLFRRTWADNQIFGTALGAADGDTEGRAGQLYDTMHGLWLAKQGGASDVQTACYWDIEDVAIEIALEFLESIGMLWLWEIMCNVSEDAAMYFAFELGMFLMMMFSGPDLDGCFGALDD